MPNAVRIIGIDPGLNRTGFGVIEARGDHLLCISAGVIRVPMGDLGERLGFILRELGAVIRETRPARASVEKVFVNVNPQSTLLLGQARGAAICAAVAAGLPVHEYTPAEVKQAVVGSGRATKEQVQLMMVRLLALAEAPQADAADALACAVCNAHSSRLMTVLDLPHGAVRSGKAAGRTRGSGARRAWTTKLGGVQ
ncbi:MAG: crossover junction endodeoxyribonuclease RuvC [Burkholderiaceae bacterium]